MSKSIVKLQLERELDNGDISNEQVAIKRLKVRQINQTLRIVTELAEIIEENPDLREFVIDTFQGSEEFDPSQYEGSGLSDEEIAELQKAFDKAQGEKFTATIMGAFRTMLLRFPDHAIKLLAAMSRIDEDLLMDQEAAVLFDVIDAIVEVNDLEELVERGKQSFSMMQNAFSWMKKKDKPKKAVAPASKILS